MARNEAAELLAYAAKAVCREAEARSFTLFGVCAKFSADGTIRLKAEAADEGGLRSPYRAAVSVYACPGSLFADKLRVERAARSLFEPCDEGNA